MKRNVELENKILELNSSGLTNIQIGERLGIDRKWVGELLKRNNIPQKRRKYFFNEEYFDIIDTEEKAYWLGFIFADGSVNNYYLKIEIQKRDKELLNKFACTLDYKGPIKTLLKKDRSYVNLCICSKKIATSLKKIGITSNKTKYPEIPKITDELFIPFLRGLSDGDGTVYYNEIKNIACWRLNVHEAVVPHIAQKLKQIIPNLTFQITNHHRTHYMKKIACDGNRNTLCLLNSLYTNSGIHLNRKYVKFQKLLEWITKNTNNPQRKINKITKYKGVILEHRTNKYRAVIKINGKQKGLGTFKTQEEAALAYNAAALTYKGTAAILNII